MKHFLSVLTGFICVIPFLSGCSSDSSVRPVVPTITWPAPAATVYGRALSSTQLNATSNYAGTFTYSPGLGTVPDAGTQTLNATFTPSDSSKVASATATNAITVNKATPAVTVSPASSSITTAQSVAVTVIVSATDYGRTPSGSVVLSSGSYTSSSAALSSGSAVITVPAGSLPAGSDTLTATYMPDSGGSSYKNATGTAVVSLTVNSQLCTSWSYCWNNVRIVAGGYVTGVYFHPTQQNLAYIRTDIGGAYRRGPNDSQWVPLLDFLPNSNGSWIGVEALGLDPTNANMLYLAVGEYIDSWNTQNGAMLVSSDQGATFKTVPLNFKNGSNDSGRGTGNRIAVDPNNPSTVYFGTRTAGLQISTDSGSTWNPMGSFPQTGTVPGDSGPIATGVVSVLPIKSSGSAGSATPVVYAAVGGTGTNGNPQGFYVSTNAGSASSTWVAVTGQPSLTGASQNISETVNGTPTLFSLAPLEAKASSDGSIYILYGDQAGPGSMNISQLWKFVPGSNWISGTWTKIRLPNSVAGGKENYTPDGVLYNSYGGLEVDPTYPGHLLLGTLDQYYPTGDVVYRSTDDGATWRDVSSVDTGGSSLSPNLATHDNTIAPYGGAPGKVSTGNWPTGIAIDPFNPDRAMYGFGGGLWITTDLTKSDPSLSSTGVVDWKLDDLGIEETAIMGLLAPPSGNTILLSSIGDIYGFAHTDLTVSPAQGNFSNPAATPTSLDFEQNTPTTVVRVVDGTYGASPLGTISTDGGMTWKGFVSLPAGSTKGGGSIAIAPDGSSMVWAPEDTSSVWYSKNGGGTWTASTGINAQTSVISDRVKAGVYYGYDAAGTFTMSADGGATFTILQTGLPVSLSWQSVKPVLHALPDAQGDLWLTSGPNNSGLYTNTGSGASPNLTAISSVQQSNYLGFGKAAPGSSKLTLFLNGTIGTQWGLYRSTDGGSSWIRINDDAHQWGGTGPICGDMRTFGTVYVAARGIIWGTSAN